MREIAEKTPVEWNMKKHKNTLPKYEIWGRSGKSRKRLSSGFATEAKAGAALAKLKTLYDDVVIVERPARCGTVKRLQRKGRVPNRE